MDNHKIKYLKKKGVDSVELKVLKVSLEEDKKTANCVTLKGVEWL
jgi:hypothetical protein